MMRSKQSIKAERLSEMQGESCKKEVEEMNAEKGKKEFESFDDILDYIEDSSDDLIINIKLE